jgi:hypothetical protein
MKQYKSKFHSRVVDVHLHTVKHTDISKVKPNFSLIAEQGQTQDSHLQGMF